MIRIPNIKICFYCLLLSLLFLCSGQLKAVDIFSDHDVRALFESQLDLFHRRNDNLTESTFTHLSEMWDKIYMVAVDKKTLLDSDSSPDQLQSEFFELVSSHMSSLETAVTPSRINLWVATSVEIGGVEKTEYTSLTNFQTDGINFGISAVNLNKSLVGFSLGHGEDKTGVGTWATRSTTNDYAMSVYGSKVLSKELRLDTALSAHKYKFESFRQPGNALLNGKRNAHQFAGSVRLAKSFVRKNFLISSFLQADIGTTKLGSFTENNGLRPVNFSNQTLYLRRQNIGISIKHHRLTTIGVIESVAQFEHVFDSSYSSDITAKYMGASTLDYYYTNRFKSDIFKGTLGLKIRLFSGQILARYVRTEQSEMFNGPQPNRKSDKISLYITLDY